MLKRSNGVCVIVFAFCFLISLLSLVEAQAQQASPGAQNGAPVAMQATGGPEAVSFSEAWGKILERSLRLRTQGYDVEANKQKKLAAWGAFTPTVVLKGTETRTGERNVVSVQGNDSRVIETNLGPAKSAEIVGSVNLFRSGADIAGLRAAENDLSSSKEKLGRQRQVSEEEAAQSLIQLISREQTRRITEKIVQIQADSLKVARERYQQGLLPLQEVDKTGIELENAKASLVDAETSLDSARAELEDLLGHSNVRIEWPWRDLLAKGTDILTRTFSLEKRPDWKASQFTVEAEKFRRRQAIGALLPSLDFAASYGYRDIPDTGPRNWATYLTLTIPLFEGFKGYTDYKIQNYNYLEAQVQSEKIRRAVGPEVDSLRQSFKVARESALAREKTAQLSQKIFADNFQRFRMGRASVNDLAIDQNRLYKSELLAVEGWASAHLYFVRLCHALGSYVQSDGTCREEPPVM